MTSKLPILYSFRRCPYAIRARMTLRYCQIETETREVKLSNKPDSLIKLSPKGTVPVLLLENGTVLEESLEIMLWGLATSDTDDWLSMDRPDIHNQALELIWENDTVFKTHLDHYKYADRFPEFSALHYRQICEGYLKKYNNSLHYRRFLAADKVSFADIAIFPFIRQCAYVDKDWFDNLPYTHLQKWLECFLHSPLFKAVMVKQPLYSDLEKQNP